MPFVFFDDQFPISRKVAGLSDAAFRLHVSAFFWCARNLTDGHVPAEDLDDVCARVRTPERFVAELVKRGLWHEAGHGCESEDCPDIAGDGWVIHDYFERQPTKQEVLEKRKANAERQRRHRERQRDTESRSENNAVSNAKRNALLTRPKSKSLSSPEGTRTGTGSQSSSRRNARGWADDDDSIDLGIIKAIKDLTGRDISALEADRIRREILDGRQVKNRAAYVARAIEDNPGKFLPADAGEQPEQAAAPLRAVPPWCGHCDRDDYRWLELADGTWHKCPACHPDIAGRRSAS